MRQQESNMSQTDHAARLAELDRVLNDPEVPMEPAQVWSLLAEIARHEAEAG